MVSGYETAGHCQKRVCYPILPPVGVSRRHRGASDDMSGQLLGSRGKATTRTISRRCESSEAYRQVRYSNDSLRRGCSSASSVGDIGFSIEVPEPRGRCEIVVRAIYPKQKLSKLPRPRSQGGGFSLKARLDFWCA